MPAAANIRAPSRYPSVYMGVVGGDVGHGGDVDGFLGQREHKESTGVVYRECG